MINYRVSDKGYIQLAIRSGQYKKLNVQAVKEGELIKYDPFNEEIEIKLIENPDEREKAETTGYYAMFEYTNGFKKCIYWSKEKMLTHADKYSQAFSANGGETVTDKFGKKHTKVSFADFVAKNYDEKDEWLYSSFWYKDFDGMAYKTMLRQLISKWGIMSIEMQTAIDKDMTVTREDGSFDYIDNEPIDTGYIEADYSVSEKEEKTEEEKEIKKTQQPSIIPSKEERQEEQDPFGYDDPFES